MCGILGSAGTARVPKEQNLILQALLVADQVRGRHATGIYMVRDDGKMLYAKQPGPASSFVRSQPWKHARQFKHSVFLGHNRWATHGDHNDSINNHPHMTDDKKLALVHNGVISEYHMLKHTYPCKSECDSEIILRIVESRLPDVKAGIEQVFASCSGFSCLLSHVDAEGTPRVWGFRDNHYPVVIIDATSEFGCYFFASTEAVWADALKQAQVKRDIKKELSAIELLDVPEHHMFCINTFTNQVELVEKAPVIKQRLTSSYGWCGGDSGVSHYFGGRGQTRHNSNSDDDDSDGESAIFAQLEGLTNDDEPAFVDPYDCAPDEEEMAAIELANNSTTTALDRKFAAAAAKVDDDNDDDNDDDDDTTNIVDLEGATAEFQTQLHQVTSADRQKAREEQKQLEEAQRQTEVLQRQIVRAAVELKVKAGLSRDPEFINAINELLESTLLDLRLLLTETEDGEKAVVDKLE